MNAKTYSKLETYMLSCMSDSAHDKEHIYRVLYTALDIARTEEHVDYDVLICACLLHDIGRREQFEDPRLCHATVGADKAYRFLTANGFDAEFAEKVKKCIETHRFKKNNPPQSLEAQILFDADKVDAAGALGIARTLAYAGRVSVPLYTMLPDGQVSDGENDEEPSFFQEYKRKLEKIYSGFYTARGTELAKQRQETAVRFYRDMLCEVTSSYANGIGELRKVIE